MAALIALGGCASQPPAPSLSEASAVRAHIASLLPASVPDRAGWAVDIYAAFTALGLEPSNPNVCAVLAVAEQESTYRADPAVPRIGRIARDEIDRRADRAGVPRLLVQAALQMHSPDSRTYAERIEAAQTEKDLSDAFEDFIASVPLGRQLFSGYNPVRTGGPMQVSVAFAESQIKARSYPYRLTGSVRDEVFSRRGGLYFGIAHLLDYPARYDDWIYRFADFNAGRYASRNAAFQQAVSVVTGKALELDGDLVLPGSDTGQTEAALRSLGPRLEMDQSTLHRELEQEDRPGLEQTRIYTRVFALAEQHEHRALPRAMLPRIELHSPKITRPLTTEWFARRVDERFKRCLGRAG
jgi:hypothetical protein